MLDISAVMKCAKCEQTVWMGSTTHSHWYRYRYRTSEGVVYEQVCPWCVYKCVGGQVSRFGEEWPEELPP
jgi:hypothetical protein